ncbi:MAG: hypothetical protein KGH63_01675, partial [Candidatus Micrarchaeota archaeon]|nr:hypothetical protein [Candidatus Micrarchaeota archaeon]
MGFGKLQSVLALIALALLLSISISFADATQVCAPPGSATSLTLDYSHNSGDASGLLSAYLFYTDATPKQVGLPGALLIVADGVYVPNSKYDPFGPGQPPNGVCKMVTGPDGKASAALFHPPGGVCVQHRVVFCPFTGSNSQNKTDLATCAQLTGPDNKLVKTLDWKSIPDCPGAAPAVSDGSVRNYGELGCGSNSDCGPTQICEVGTYTCTPSFRPVQNAQQVCNTSPSPATVGLCWSLALIFGLLFSAAFISGRNPLAFLDFGAARSVRMNRNAGYYMPMTQNVSVNVTGMAQAADKAANMVSAAAGSYSDKKADTSTVKKDASGKPVIDKATGKPVLETRTISAGSQRMAAMGAASQSGLLGGMVSQQLGTLTGKASGALGINSETSGGKALTGLVQGAIVGGMVGLVSMVAGGKRAKPGKAILSAVTPFAVKAGGQYALDSGVAALVKTQSSSAMPDTTGAKAAPAAGDVLTNFKTALANLQVVKDLGLT